MTLAADYRVWGVKRCPRVPGNHVSSLLLYLHRTQPLAVTHARGDPSRRVHDGRSIVPRARTYRPQLLLVFRQQSAILFPAGARPSVGGLSEDWTSLHHIATLVHRLRERIADIAEKNGSGEGISYVAAAHVASLDALQP